MKILTFVALSATAALAAVASAHASELRPHARPAHRVATCSRYGAGFRYVPGTGACVKVGGWVRSEVSSGGAGRVNWGALNERATSDVAMPVRGEVGTDIRKPTGYGTVRAYLSVGVDGH